jgi:O-antigen/teichoic acid export membrane protein
MNIRNYLRSNNKSTKDIIATFFNQAWRLVSGPLMLLLIPLYLTEVQQGYWYLFGSIAALSTFADLGFSNIILQFSAHEYSFLKIEENGILVGPDEKIKKLGSLFRYVLNWLLKICSVVFPIIYIIGLFYLTRDKALSYYFLPWTIYAIGSLVNFINSSILSFIEGLDQISKIQNTRLVVAVTGSVLTITCLLLKLNIYAISISLLLSSSVMFFTIFKTFGMTIKQIWRESKDFEYPWKKEIWPLFRKYILTFASGYFLFQIYTPFIHYFHGPVYSGKVGISMSLVNAIFSFSNIWIYTIIPRMNMLVEQKDWRRLDKLFHKRFILGIITYLFIVVCFALFVIFFKNIPLIHKIVSRFLPAKSIGILTFAYLLYFMVSAWATYLRSHKEEPFWLPSIIAAVWVTSITAIAGKFLPVEYFFVGILSQYFWAIPLYYTIYRKLKNKWHTVSGKAAVTAIDSNTINNNFEDNNA